MSAKSKSNKPEQPPNLDHSYSVLVGWILPRLGNATPIAVHNKLSLQSAIAMTGCTTAVFGWIVHVEWLP